MKWPGPVIETTFLRRYKRFFADFDHDSQVITAHCANTGSMSTCLKPGARCLLTHHPDPKRKLAYSWQAIEMDDGWVGVNTAVPNSLVREAIERGVVEELSGYLDIKGEVKINAKSRLDLMLSRGDERIYVEVKNATLQVGPTLAAFPDSVTSRGQKHIQELIELKAQGHRAVLFFCVQRCAARRMRPADEIDPAYGKLLRQAVEQGVEVLAYRAEIDSIGVNLVARIPVELDPICAS